MIFFGITVQVCQEGGIPLKTKNTNKDAFVIGFALFAMFFGAGSLIFPPYLGMGAGKEWVLGFLCFFIADIGLAFVTIIAMINGDGSISGITRIIGNIPSLIMNTAVILCIGPMLAIPRTAATTYEMTILPIFSNVNIILFSIVFFTVVILLTIRPSKVVDIVGKFLTPLMVLSLIILIGAGVLHPLGEIGEPVIDSTVKEGILNGYQAMDVLGALGFAIIIITSVHEHGYTENKERVRVSTKACLLSGIMLFLVYIGLTYLGATVSLRYDINTVNQASLIVDITKDLLGFPGVVILGIVVGLACLTTAIGLTSASAAYFENITHGKIRYHVVVILIGLFSMVVSNFGLSTIISIATPILSLVYPVVVVLILLSFFRNKIKNPHIYKGAALFAFVISFLTILESYGIQLDFIHFLPFSSVGLNWILPAVIGGIIGALIRSDSTKA